MRVPIAVMLCVATVAIAGTADAQESPFMGRWALTPLNGGAGWLEVREEGGALAGSLLWMGGSPEVQTRVYLDGDTLCAIRVRQDIIRDAAGRETGQQWHPILVMAKLYDGKMQGQFSEPSSDGKATYKQAFSGAKIPDLPPAPELSKIEFGEPEALFNGGNLNGWVVIGGPHWAEVKKQKPGAAADAGWTATDEGVANGWFAKDGVLTNDPVQKEGQPHIRYGNLATREQFEDFNLKLEVNVPPGGNSGVYLRGIYEIQVVDSFGKPLDCHNMGALYGRIAPAESAEKPAGEWQTLDVTLVDRHITVILNGKKVIDNQPAMGCTGGALWSDEFIPGPIYLQGDHTGVAYRNVVMRPVVKK